MARNTNQTVILVIDEAVLEMEKINNKIEEIKDSFLSCEIKCEYGEIEKCMIGYGEFKRAYSNLDEALGKFIMALRKIREREEDECYG